MGNRNSFHGINFASLVDVGQDYKSVTTLAELISIRHHRWWSNCSSSTPRRVEVFS